MKTESVNEHLIGKTYDQIIPLLAFDEDQGDCCGFARWDKIGDHQLPADIDTSLMDTVRSQREHIAALLDSPQEASDA